MKKDLFIHRLHRLLTQLRAEVEKSNSPGVRWLISVFEEIDGELQERVPSMKEREDDYYGVVRELSDIDLGYTPLAEELVHLMEDYLQIEDDTSLPKRKHKR